MTRHSYEAQISETRLLPLGPRRTGFLDLGVHCPRKPFAIAQDVEAFAKALIPYLFRHPPKRNRGSRRQSTVMLGMNREPLQWPSATTVLNSNQP